MLTTSLTLSLSACLSVCLKRTSRNFRPKLICVLLLRGFCPLTSREEKSCKKKKEKKKGDTRTHCQSTWEFIRGEFQLCGKRDQLEPSLPDKLSDSICSHVNIHYARMGVCVCVWDEIH